MTQGDDNTRSVDVRGVPVDGVTMRTTLTPSPAVLVFDGECAMCRRCAAWVRRRRRAPSVVAYQEAPLTDWGLSRDACERAVQWVGATRCEGAPAVAAVLVHLGWPWSAAGWMMKAPGVRWLAGRVYARVSVRRRCRIDPPVA
jgi:predicted DCC family thiol-disulfide oxidoreductase YuxK